MKVIKKDNYRVVIEPKRLGDYGIVSMPDYFIESDENKRNLRYKELCDKIVEDVRRHVDNVGNIYIDFDTEEICEYCGLTWETDENGCPVCCQKAIDEYENRKKK